MVLIGTRLREHIDLRDFAAEFRRIYARLHLELLQRVNRGQNHERIEIRVGVLDAVQRVVIEIRALPRHRDGLAGTNAALPCACLSLACESGGHVRRQRHQLKVIAPVQRQFDDAPVLDDGADRCIVGDQRPCFTLHFNRLVDLSYLQFDIDSGRLLHLQFNLIPDDGLEAWLLRAQQIGARWERRKRIGPRIIRDYIANSVRIFVGRRYGDPSYRRPGGIACLSVDGAKRLAKGNPACYETARQNKQASVC